MVESALTLGALRELAIVDTCLCSQAEEMALFKSFNRDNLVLFVSKHNGVEKFMLAGFLLAAGML
jgi:hypothetical protein